MGNNTVKVTLEYEMSIYEIESLRRMVEYFKDKSPAFIPMDKALADCDVSPTMAANLVIRGFADTSLIEWDDGKKYEAINITRLGERLLEAAVKQHRSLYTMVYPK